MAALESYASIKLLQELLVTILVYSVIIVGRRFMSGKKIRCLVMGSHGFLGEHLVSKLEQLNYEVVRGDRAGTLPSKIDYIFDCATYGNRYDQRNLTQIIDVNILNLANFINKVKKSELKKHIYISSSAVTLSHQTPYSASKVLGEFIVGGLDPGKSLVVRPYTLYGPGDKDHLIPVVFDSCLSGTLFKLDPTPTHDYVYIDDFVEILVDWAFKDVSGSYVIEIGTHIATTNLEVVQLIEFITKRKANYEIETNQRPYDNKDWKSEYYCPQIKTDLPSGLIKTYEYIKQGFKKKNTYH